MLLKGRLSTKYPFHKQIPLRLIAHRNGIIYYYLSYISVSKHGIFVHDAVHLFAH